MLNPRCILPLKVAIALTLAIVSALWLGWERPYWAGFAVVVMAATETSGHSLKKGRHRLVGTLIGVIAAFILVASFAQQPLPFLLGYSLFAALCVYLQGNPRSGYMWTICLMVCSLVLVMGKLLPELTFSMAVLRVQETVLGILCFTLVFSLFWPSSSRTVVTSTLHLYFDNQIKQLQVAKNELAEQGSFTKELNLGDSLRQLTRLEDLIYAASADSYHITQDYAKWQALLRQLNQWALLCGHLAELNDQIKGKVTPGQTAVLASLIDRLSQRAHAALAILDGKPKNGTIGIQAMPSPVSLLNSSKHDVNSQKQHGATLILGTLLTELDQLQFDIVEALYDLTGTTNSKKTSFDRRYKDKWVFRPDSAIAALKACLVIWACIALWLLVPMPGGAMVVLLGAILSTVVLSLPFAKVKTLLFSMLGWSLFVLAQYVLLMPMLTELWQLAAFYFVNAFGIWYLLNQPQQVLQRMLGSQLLIMMTSGAMQLTPVYDIQMALLQLMLIIVVMLIVFFINHSVFPNTPESTFLRELGRLRSGLKHEMGSHCAPNKPFQLHPDPLRSVAMAENAASRINWATYPEVDPKKVSELINSAYKACLLYWAFKDNHQRWRLSTHSKAIEVLVAKIMNSLAGILEESSISEALTAHQQQLDDLLSELQHYLIGLDRESVLQFSLCAEDADASYRLLTSLKLLIASLKSLSSNVQKSEVHHLRLQPFAV